ncbi:MAG: PorT family protein [Bacteroidales bacterium]|nr:PorT family protein [Bacteroidales bacterium]
MKSIKTIIAIIVLPAVLTITAQTQITIGIRAGVNLQNINGKNYADDKLDNGMIVGYNAGVNVEIPIAKDIYLQPGLLFATKGAKNKEVSPEARIGISYIELPVNLVYKALLGSGHVFLGFGPYAAYGIAGKVEDTKIDFKKEMTTAENNAFKAFDMGANLLAGYEFEFDLLFQLNFQLGLLEIYPDNTGDTNDKTSYKNTGFGLSLGYRF